MRAPNSIRPPAALIALLSAMVALGPISIDLYLPAMPGFVTVFGTSVSMVQLTMSSYLVGFALFHLLCGPLADSYGRRPILLAGLTLYTLASLACALSTTIEGLVFTRFLQGVGACVGPTLGRAIARDVYGPKEAARALAIIAMIMAIAPAAAPTLGGLILTWFEWPALFLSMFAAGLAIIVWSSTSLSETNPHQQPFRAANIFANFLSLLRHSLYRRVVLSSGLLYAGMLSFVTGSSFVLIVMKGVAPQLYGLYFIWVVIGYVLGSFLTSRLTGRYPARALMRAGAVLSVLAAVLMLGLEMLWGKPLGIVIPMAAYCIGIGLVLPNATACALRPFATMAATASALFGFVQMGLAALAAATVGLLLTDSAIPMILLMLVVSGASSLIIFTLSKPEADPAE